jgi:GT2 family glycosyltransferase
MECRSLHIVTATRLTESEFFERSALGRSMGRFLPDARTTLCVFFENRRGLSELYNGRIAADTSDAIAFVHDDVWIEDYYFVDRVLAGLAAYDVIGVAGSLRRAPSQPTWAHLDDDFTEEDSSNLSGRVAHGPYPLGTVTVFGRNVPSPCELLDGVLLAASRRVLSERGVLFDPRFDFHFYDMDFCRTARAKGLRLGTWPICITHQSAGTGGFGTPQWTAKRDLYREKWKD